MREWEVVFGRPAADVSHTSFSPFTSFSSLLFYPHHLPAPAHVSYTPCTSSFSYILFLPLYTIFLPPLLSFSFSILHLLLFLLFTPISLPFPPPAACAQNEQHVLTPEQAARRLEGQHSRITELEAALQAEQQACGE